MSVLPVIKRMQTNNKSQFLYHKANILDSKSMHALFSFFSTLNALSLEDIESKMLEDLESKKRRIMHAFRV